MKRNYILVVLISITMAVFTFQSCTKESTIAIPIYGAFTTPAATAPVVRADGTVLFTGSSVNLSWNSTNKQNEVATWKVYFGTKSTPPLYQSGVSAKTISVPVTDGTTYYWSVETIDSRMVKTKSETWSFTAVNGTNPDIGISLTTTTDIKTQIGLDLAADDVVDVRFLVLDKNDQSEVAVIDDGYADESFSDFGTLPDGEYILAVDLGSTVNAGDFNKVLNLSFNLQFDQLGMINKSLDFPKAMDNANPCELYRTNLAIVKKEGSVYTITKDVEKITPPVLTWVGTDADYPSQITSTATCTENTLTGVVNGWMLDWWGEVIISGGTLKYTTSGSNIKIPLQKYCITKYNGAVQDEYSITGTGTIDNSGQFPVIHLKYDLIQAGSSIGTIANQYGWPTKYFEATITTNPAGL